MGCSATQDVADYPNIATEVQNIWKWIESKSSLAICCYGLVFAAFFEGFTCLFRFGLGMQATEDTNWLAAWTLGFRIHHGYFGLLLILLSLMASNKTVRRLFLLVGIGLFVSDAVHHFLVLWPITGSPDFDLRYPS